jgi:hypothetical protein
VYFVLVLEFGVYDSRYSTFVTKRVGGVF